MKNKNYYDISKEELIRQLNLHNKKYNKWISRCEWSLFMFAIMSIITILPMVNIINYPIIYVRLSGVCSILSTISLLVCMEKSSDVKDNIFQLQKQLYNIVTMKFEKDRYSLDKELEKKISNNENNIAVLENDNNSKINLLKKYKEELEEYNILFDKENIEKELENKQYVKSLFNTDKKS